VHDNTEACRVLVVDDHKPTRELLKAFLRGFGANIVAEAENGEAAVRAFDEHAPDLILLDLEMPIKDGRDTLRELLEKDTEAYVVILTATSEMSVANSCIEAGARNFIRKGVPPGVLKMMLKTQLDSCCAG